MKAVFFQDGGSIDYTPENALAAGSVVVLGNLVCVSKIDCAAGRQGALATRGVCRVNKDASAIALGGPVYFDADGTPVDTTDTVAGAFTSTAAGNPFAGWALEAAGTAAPTVLVLLRSAEDRAVLALADLSDVGATGYTAGKILVADGDSYAEVALSGDVTLAASGAATLNDAHAEQTAYIPVAALEAGADLAATIQWAHPRACTLVSVGFLSGGDFGTVDNGNTAVFAVTDGGGNGIVSKTYNTATQPSSTAINDLGALDGTHKALTAGETVSLAITNGATAATPAGVLVIRYIPTNA